MLTHSLPMKRRKRLAHDVTNTSTIYASFVLNITDTECQTLNGSTYGRSRVRPGESLNPER